MSLETIANKVLAAAREIAGRVRTWADFSNEIHGPGGVVAKAFPEEIQRQAFYDSAQCKEIDGLLASLMRSQGVAAGAKASEKSGKFVVRVPKGVHEKLEIEARREGVSLNQLAACKLSIPLLNSSGLKKEIIVDAFNDVHDGYSTDWVIIEPDFNRRFLSKCRQLGLKHSGWTLNHTLMNIRKTKKYSERMEKATKRSGFTDYDDYAFASEISVRCLQRTEGVTLDRILCDPELRERFDELATQLAPAFSAVQFRSAALNLRKGHRLKPMKKNTTVYDLVSAGPLKQVDLSEISALPGGYVLYDFNRPIFAGETENLKKRISMHLGSGLPKWLSIDKEESLLLKTFVVPSSKQQDRLDWLDTFINVERPLLNYQCAA